VPKIELIEDITNLRKYWKCDRKIEAKYEYKVIWEKR